MQRQVFAFLNMFILFSLQLQKSAELCNNLKINTEAYRLSGLPILMKPLRHCQDFIDETVETRQDLICHIQWVPNSDILLRNLAIILPIHLKSALQIFIKHQTNVIGSLIYLFSSDIC